MALDHGKHLQLFDLQKRKFFYQSSEFPSHRLDLVMKKVAKSTFYVVTMALFCLYDTMEEDSGTTVK